MSSGTEAQQRPLARVALGLLAALVLTNAALLILLQTSGPLVGLVLYVVLLWRWRRRDYRAVMVGGLVGLAVHVAEVGSVGRSAYPALMTLNLILPAVLALVAWLAVQRVQQEDGGQRGGGYANADC